MDDIRDNLCIQDRRHPYHFDIEWDHEPKPGGDCACDACFYGRHPLASEIIAHRRFVEEVEEANDEHRGTNSYLAEKIDAALTRLKKEVG